MRDELSALYCPVLSVPSLAWLSPLNEPPTCPVSVQQCLGQEPCCRHELGSLASTIVVMQVGVRTAFGAWAQRMGIYHAKAAFDTSRLAALLRPPSVLCVPSPTADRSPDQAAAGMYPAGGGAMVGSSCMVEHMLLTLSLRVPRRLVLALRCPAALAAEGCCETGGEPSPQIAERYGVSLR